MSAEQEATIPDPRSHCPRSDEDARNFISTHVRIAPAAGVTGSVPIVPEKQIVVFGHCKRALIGGGGRVRFDQDLPIDPDPPYLNPHPLAGQSNDALDDPSTKLPRVDRNHCAPAKAMPAQGLEGQDELPVAKAGGHRV